MEIDYIALILPTQLNIWQRISPQKKRKRNLANR